MSKTYNLFISHSWSYGDAYEKLIGLLHDKKYFSFRDYSVPMHDPIRNAANSNQLYIAIKNQVATCHVVLVMAGKYATYSTWIQNEIKIAKTEFVTSKPILAITPWGAQQISSFVRANADLVVKWNTDSIVQGIRDISI